jgi:SAM-dependent methyltransferase
MALNSRLKNIAERVLPRRILAWLDPVQDLIDSEVRLAADRLHEGHIVLDAGAGESRHKKYFKRARYIALDAGHGDSGWDYSKLDICGDLSNIPLRNESVDCILCMVVLEHTPNPRKVLLEFARILKPGGTLTMIVPFLWEEHQVPHDYFRFTRYGVRSLFESIAFRLDLVSPIGGFFWLCARRILFPFLAPFFGLLFPLILYFMDGLDQEKNYSLGFQIRGTKLS